MLDAIKNLVLYDTRMQLASGFKFAYLALLKGLAEEDYNVVSSGCEGNLYKEFASSLDVSREKQYKL